MFKLFASLTHELRTPLNCSIVMIEMLLEKIEDEELKSGFLQPALQSNYILLYLVNGLLDFVQLDS
jgi:aminomethyltransferase